MLWSFWHLVACFASDDSKARNEMFAGSQALKNLEWLTLQPTVGSCISNHKHGHNMQGGLLVASHALPVEFLSRHRLLPNFQRD